MNARHCGVQTGSFWKFVASFEDRRLLTRGPSTSAAHVSRCARPVLVPTPVTRAEEVAAAPEVAGDLTEAVDLLLGPAPRPEHAATGNAP